MSQEPLLNAEHVSYSYETGKQVLKDISLTIKQGEKIVLLGPNGAGKSTFLLLLNGVLKPDQGAIYDRGQIRKGKDRKKTGSQVGLVFQEPDNQIIGTNVFAELSFGPMNLSLPKDEVRKRVKHTLERLGIEHLSDRLPHYLSGGEKKKVSIGDIKVMEPEVYLFDEATAALDPKSAKETETLMEELAEEGNTLIAATHDVEFAWRFASRIIVFFEGTVIADGTPVEVFSKEDVLKKAHLKKPILWSICELLKNHAIWNETAYPKTIEELEEQFKGEWMQ